MIDLKFIEELHMLIFVSKPRDLAELPKIDKTEFPDYVKVYTQEDINEYFKNVGDCISDYNGIQHSDAPYCRGKCSDRRREEGRIEIIDIKDGEEYYYSYDDYNTYCKECGNSNMELRVYRESFIRWCNECGEPCWKYYSGANNYDICRKCYKMVEAGELVLKTEVTKTKNGSKQTDYDFYYSGFGSMLYWVPLIEIIECLVLINLDKADKNYGRICIGGNDDHGRHGYYMLKPEYDLSWVLGRLKEIINRGYVEIVDMEDIDGKWVDVVKKVPFCSGEYDYDTPIHVLMEELNMPIHYG